MKNKPYTASKSDDTKIEGQAGRTDDPTKGMGNFLGHLSENGELCSLHCKLHVDGVWNQYVSFVSG